MHIVVGRSCGDLVEIVCTVDHCAKCIVDRGSLSLCTRSTLPGSFAIQEMELKASLVKFSIFSRVSNVTSLAWGASNPPQAIEVNLKKWTHGTATSGNWVQRFKCIKFIGGSCLGWFSAKPLFSFSFAAKWSNAIIQRYALARWEGFRLLILIETDIIFCNS